jgi:hypothetical protein
MIAVKNVRVAVVHREGEKDWAGTGRYLSMRAYTGKGEASMMGPEIPIHEGMSDNAIEQFWQHCILASCGKDPDASATEAA